MAFFTNQAQLRYGNEVANSNITVGEIQEVLSVTKSAVKQTYRQHDTVTYIINIVNAGTAEYTGLTMTDDLDDMPLEKERVRRRITWRVPFTITGTVCYRQLQLWKQDHRL